MQRLPKAIYSKEFREQAVPMRNLLLFASRFLLLPCTGQFN